MIAIVAAVLCVAPGSHAPIRIAEPGLAAVNVSESLATFTAESLAEQLSQRGLQVTTTKEIAELLGLERQRQLMGCSDAGSSCAVELANALGVDALLSGEVALLGTQYHLDLKVLASSDGRRLASFSGVADDEQALGDVIWQAANEIAHQTASALGREATLKEPPPRVVTSSGAIRRHSWVPAVAGLAFAGAAAVTLGIAKADYDQIAAGGIASLDKAQSVQEEGQTLQVLGVVAVGVAAAALIGGGAMFALGGPQGASVAVAPGPGGLSVAVGGSFP